MNAGNPKATCILWRNETSEFNVQVLTVPILIMQLYA